MTEPTSPAAEDDGGQTAQPRNWKKLAVYGAGGVLVIGVGIGIAAGVIVLLRPAKVPAPAGHQVSIAAPVAAPLPAPVATEPLPSQDDRELLQAEVDQLQAQKRRLLREQAELQRQREAMILRQQGLSGEKQCQLSGDPVRRKEELRACFGLASLMTQQASAADAGPATQSSGVASAAVASGARAAVNKPVAAAAGAVAKAAPTAASKAAPAGSLQSLQGRLDQLRIPGLQTRQVDSSKAAAKPASAPVAPTAR